MTATDPRPEPAAMPAARLAPAAEREEPGLTDSHIRPRCLRNARLQPSPRIGVRGDERGHRASRHMPEPVAEYAPYACRT